MTFVVTVDECDFLRLLLFSL